MVLTFIVVSSDGDEFEISQQAAHLIGFLKPVLECRPLTDTCRVSMPVTSEVLELVVKYCEHHATEIDNNAAAAGDMDFMGAKEDIVPVMEADNDGTALALYGSEEDLGSFEDGVTMVAEEPELVTQDPGNKPVLSGASAPSGYLFLPSTTPINLVPKSCMFISKWDRDHIVKLSPAQFHQLIMGSKALEATKLTEVCCKIIAAKIKGKTAAEIRKEFNINDSFSRTKKRWIKQEKKMEKRLQPL